MVDVSTACINLDVDSYFIIILICSKINIISVELKEKINVY
ncbi:MULTISPECIES: hypothetical protein [Clostridium]|nr:hypothetical protein [Clostridium sp. C8]